MLDPRVLAPHAVARFAAETPDVVALQHVDGSSLTYAQLDAEARTWAGAFTRVGVGERTHVGTLLSNRFEAHRTMVALGWLRAVEVPLNTSYLGTMLSYALDLADVAVLVTEAQFVERVLDVAAGLPLLETVVVVDGVPAGGVPAPDGAGHRPRLVAMGELLDGAVPATDLAGPAAHDIACLLFTSGTTGPSKAVITPWAVVWQNWSWVPDDTLAAGQALYCAMPLFHNSGRGAFNYTMACGGTLVIRDKFSATSFWDDIRAHGCTVSSAVGPMTALLWSAPPRADDADNPLESYVCGPLIPEIEAFKQRFGVRVTTTYGQTEIGCPLSTGWESVPPASCGKVRTDYPWPEVRLADELDEPVEPGEAGEMLVRTRAPWGLNVGYYKMPAETAAAWRNGWFHTGDAFTQDADGNFYFLDRKKDAIRRRGENISSFEVENLVSQHPDVVEVAAVGVRAELGEDEVLVALVVRDPGAFDHAAFIEFLRPRMPRFMIPRYVEVMDDLPRVATSMRVKKAELRERGITSATWDRDAAGIVV